ncbi:MAG: hypothetical protein ACP5G7_09685, partial [Anaerolineae bacterium]
MMAAALVWLEPVSHRVYPGSSPRGGAALRLACARGELVAWQACFRQLGPQAAEVQLDVNAPAGWEVSIRRVGYVPMPHLSTQTEATDLEGLGHVPGLVPDPLFPEQGSLVGPY